MESPESARDVVREVFVFQLGIAVSFPSLAPARGFLHPGEMRRPLRLLGASLTIAAYRAFR